MRSLRELFVSEPWKSLFHITKGFAGPHRKKTVTLTNANVQDTASINANTAVTRGLKLSLRGRQAVAIPEIFGDCQWDRPAQNAGLPVILMDRRNAYPTKTARNDILWPPVTEELP